MHVLMNAAATAAMRTDTLAAAQVWCCQVQQDISSSTATTAEPYKYCIYGCGFQNSFLLCMLAPEADRHIGGILQVLLLLLAV
jgi:hypothetical protein